MSAKKSAVMKLLRLIIILTLSLFCLQFCKCLFHLPASKPKPTNKYILAGADLDRIKELIDKGEDMNELDKIGLAPLHAIVEAIDKNTVREYELNMYSADEIDRRKDLIDRYYKAADLLLNNGADVNVMDRYGRTVLSCCRGDVKCVKFFLKYGADVNVNLALNEAACAPYFEIVKLFIANGADVNARDSKGNTPLFCCNTGEVAELLIKNGANVNVRNLRGETPLFSFHNDDNAIELMIKKGADVNVKNINGETALFQPFLGSKRVRLFVKYKININEQDNNGRTVLHYILSNNNIYYELTIFELLKSGAKVDIQDNYGMTPLNLARTLINGENSNRFQEIYNTMLKYKND